MELNRVRSLIPYLTYAELQKVLPKERLFTRTKVPTRGGTYPNPGLAKKMGPVEYGLFVEKIIECVLVNNDYETKSHFLKIREDMIQRNPHMESLCKVNSFDKTIDVLKSHFAEVENIYAQPDDWIDQKNGIIGHPDIYTKDVVYDIKTTGMFGRMRIETIFQVLSYYCLAKIKGLEITKVGLILPLQQCVIVHDLKNWKWEGFYKELCMCAEQKTAKRMLWNVNPFEFLIFQSAVNSFVGNTVPRNDLITYLATIKKPAQFFVDGNIGSNMKYMESDKITLKLKSLIEEHNTKCFIHSPYSINLCDPGKSQREGEKYKTWGGWTFDILKKLLRYGSKHSLSGVVVHCGKKCKLPLEKAIKTMRKSVIYVSRWATKECPLLIETSSGQGGETLCKPNELADFWDSLPSKCKENISICVDTCHVFAAGYDPDEYISIMSSRSIPIALVHYNDSKLAKGCFKDRHAEICKGWIGYEKLNAVLEWAASNNVPCVRE